jgi:protein-disulfide isomerase
MGREAKILIVILVIAVGGMIALFIAGGGSGSGSSVGTAADASKLVNANSHKADTGKVTVVEFGDFQCPACGAAYPQLKKIQGDYAGKVTFVFRNFPLQMHANAPAAAYAAEAAAKQNKYWEMHDKLYETQSDWSELPSDETVAKFNGYAEQLGLNIDQFKQDEAGDAVKQAVEADKTDGNALNIQSTPTIYVNGQQAASYDYATLKTLIDNALKS